MTAAEITPASLDLFLFYARDAGNWSGNPSLDGNRDFTKEDRGNLTQLKKAGLLTTYETRDPDGVWINFTEAGKALALKHGVAL